MYRVLFDRAGIVAIRCIEPDVSLVIVAFWQLFVVAWSPANRWFELARCDGPTARMRRKRQEPSR
jgi:hypothetical protein